jgi:hypothetical protein
MKELKDFFEKMQLREDYLKSQKKVKGHKFNPDERLGELQIWLLELSSIINK